MVIVHFIFQYEMAKINILFNLIVREKSPFYFLVKKEVMLLEPAADFASAFCLADPGVDSFCIFDFGSRSSE